MNSTVLDLGCILVQAGVLHLFMKAVKRRRYEFHPIRALLCAGGAWLLHAVACSGIQPFFNMASPQPVARFVSLAIWFACAMPLIRYILQPGFLLAPVTGIVLVATIFGLQLAVDQYLPSEETVAEAENPLSGVMDNLPQPGSNSNSLEVVTIAKNGLNAFNGLKSDQALKSDFRRGVDLFKERKEWMDSLTPDEKAAYRAEMRAFMAEQGLAEDPALLAGIRSANPTNLTAMASLFDHLDGMQAGTAAERSHTVAESLKDVTAHLQGVELTDSDRANLSKVSALVAANDSKGAMEELKRQLKESGGKNALAGTMMAALMQSKSGVPADMIVSEKDGGKGFDFGSLFSFGKKDEPEQPAEEAEVVEIAEAPPVAQTSLVDASVEEIEFNFSDGSYVPISAELGIVHVPSDQVALGDWVDTVQRMTVDGYASLGTETAILLEDGTIYRNGDIWQLENNGYEYRFSVDKVVKGRVHLTGLDRKALAL